MYDDEFSKTSIPDFQNLGVSKHNFGKRFLRKTIKIKTVIQNAKHMSEKQVWTIHTQSLNIYLFLALIWHYIPNGIKSF